MTQTGKNMITLLAFPVLLVVGCAPVMGQETPSLPPVQTTPAPMAPPDQSAPPNVQDPPVAAPAQTPAPTAEPPAVERPPVDLRRRRNAVIVMEGALASAVRLGAEATAREIQRVQPGLGMFTTSTARARGISLEGYGVFFHVEIPGVRPSVVSIIETLARDRARSSALQATAGTETAAVDLMFDPDAAYVNAVKSALIDAMVDYSKSLDLRPDEWLTLAARGDDVPMVPGEIFESKTMILRVRGSDLSDFLAGRLSRDEVRRKVEMREF